MKASIVSLPGDGIGREVTDEARGVLDAVAKKFGHSFSYEEHLIGGCAIDATGEALPSSTLEACQKADAVLLGAVGGPKWDDPNAKVRPEQGLLAIRSVLRNCAGHGSVSRTHSIKLPMRLASNNFLMKAPARSGHER